MAYSVLVTNSDHRKALAAIRTLGRKGNTVISSSSESIAMGRYSKFSSDFIKYPDPSVNSSEFKNFMLNYLNHKDVDIVLPMDDDTVEVFSKYKMEFTKLSKIPVPDYDLWMMGRDKAKSIKAALAVGLTCPETYFIQSLDEVNNLSSQLHFPIVIKPRISSGSRGINYIHNSANLMKIIKQIHEKYPFPLIQEYIPQTGKKYQVLLLADGKGSILGQCTHEFIRQFPVNGGPGTLWKTISYPLIEELSINLLKSINWYGIACVEFIEDPRNNRPVFMEINPRFWGTLNLCIQVGVDFPDILCKLALGERVDTKINQRFEEYCQWLMPGDLCNFIFNKNRFHQEVGYFIKDPKHIFHHATWDRKDIVPYIMNIYSLLHDLLSFNALPNILNRENA